MENLEGLCYGTYDTYVSIRGAPKIKNNVPTAVTATTPLNPGGSRLNTSCANLVQGVDHFGKTRLPSGHIHPHEKARKSVFTLNERSGADAATSARDKGPGCFARLMQPPQVLAVSFGLAGHFLRHQPKERLNWALDLHPRRKIQEPLFHASSS